MKFVDLAEVHRIGRGVSEVRIRRYHFGGPKQGCIVDLVAPCYDAEQHVLRDYLVRANPTLLVFSGFFEEHSEGIAGMAFLQLDATGTLSMSGTPNAGPALADCGSVC